MLECDVQDGRVIVRKAGRYKSADIHATLFGDQSVQLAADLKQGIKKHMRKKYVSR